MSIAEQAEATRLREVALQQAAHDCRGAGEAEHVVARARVYEGYLSGMEGGLVLMNEALVESMVNRFLSWRLPSDFQPDGGISFEPVGNVTYTLLSGGGDVKLKGQRPNGTNLFNYQQARDMVLHMLSAEGMAYRNAARI